MGSQFIEIHTGHYADAATHEERKRELEKILEGIRLAQNLGLKVNLGHGLNYVNIMPFASVPGICEYSIGHSIMARAVFVGLTEAVRAMADIIKTFPQ